MKAPFLHGAETGLFHFYRRRSIERTLPLLRSRRWAPALLSVGITCIEREHQPSDATAIIHYDIKRVRSVQINRIGISECLLGTL